MPCLHKFHDELNLVGLNYEPTTLIVGTFNPIWPAINNAPWFYGRTHDDNGNRNNNFWEVLPRLYGHGSLINAGPDEWKAFCNEYSIALTDLIYCINDAYQANNDHINWMSTYSDELIATKFFDHTMVSIVNILQNNPSLQYVYLTRGIGETFWRRKWRPVKTFARHNPNVTVKELITPSGYAFYQQGRHNNLNPQNRIEMLYDYILMRWQNEWHF